MLDKIEISQLPAYKLTVGGSSRTLSLVTTFIFRIKIQQVPSCS